MPIAIISYLTASKHLTCILVDVADYLLLAFLLKLIITPKSQSTWVWSQVYYLSARFQQDC